MGSPLITPQLKVPTLNFVKETDKAIITKNPEGGFTATLKEGQAPLPPARVPVVDSNGEFSGIGSRPVDSPPLPPFKVGVKGGPTQPSLDSAKFDSAGNEKQDAGPFGPRGEGAPLDVMTEEDKAKVAQATEKRLQAGMSSTAHVDSVGNAKGEFHVTPQGHDKHGARIPDKVDFSKPAETTPMVGPRGKGAQPDTYHGSKPSQS